MSNQVRVGNIGDIDVFESHCLDYQYGLEEYRKLLRQSLDAVGETWRDADFTAMENLVSEIDALLHRGLLVAIEDLLPFVRRKRQIIDEKR